MEDDQKGSLIYLSLWDYEWTITGFCVSGIWGKKFHYDILFLVLHLLRFS